MARRDRNRRSLQRRGPKREPYDRVLIVCEGEKTEPNYLNELISSWQLSSANVVVKGDGGAAPISVVNDAIDLFERSPDYDRVYCVFDRDAHRSFNEALARIKEKKLIRRVGKKATGAAHFEAIVSIPCFEYWVLLHFTYSTAHMSRHADVRAVLGRFPELSSYDKGFKGLFALTSARLETALANADRANNAALNAGTDNPTTQMPNLIRYLHRLSRGKGDSF